MLPEELDLYRKHQGLFREKLNGWKDGDHFILPESSNIFTFKGAFWFDVTDAIRLPAAIDSDGPYGSPSGRCLWGMVDWSKYKPSINDSGNIAMWVKGEDGKVLPQAQWNHTPTLALLKAIDAQEAEDGSQS